jgi:hypothetical protein
MCHRISSKENASLAPRLFSFTMDITMAAAAGNNVDAPSCAPTQLNKQWIGSIKFRCIPAYQFREIAEPLDKMDIKEVDICEYLGCLTKYPLIHRLYLDPEKYDKPPLVGEPVIKNPHWMQLRTALEAASHTSGSPIMCNGGTTRSRVFRCKLRNRLYRPKSIAKKDGKRPELINVQSMRTLTTQALTKDDICPFTFTVKWDLFGFYITLYNYGTGCPNHDNHLQSDFSKLSLPKTGITLGKEKEILEDTDAFASSLLVDEELYSLAMAPARDILKPQIDEILQLLDTLKSKKSIETATKVLKDLAQELHLEIAATTLSSSSSGSKRNIENNSRTKVNNNRNVVEENLSRKSRSYASRNC